MKKYKWTPKQRIRFFVLLVLCLYAQHLQHRDSIIYHRALRFELWLEKHGFLREVLNATDSGWR